MQKIFTEIFLPTFPLMEKSAKDQADGKCSRTGPYAPTVGRAYARSDRGKCRPDSLQGLVEQVMKRKIPLLLESTKERVQSYACMGYAERGGERGRSLQRVPGGRVVTYTSRQSRTSCVSLDACHVIAGCRLAGLAATECHTLLWQAFRSAGLVSPGSGARNEHRHPGDDGRPVCSAAVRFTSAPKNCTCSPRKGLITADVRNHVVPV